MYKRILIPLENSPADDTILRHIRQLARLTGASLLLVHVADGFGARNQAVLEESQEMKGDRAYLNAREAELAAAGFEVKSFLECGEPAEGILAIATKYDADLIAMATHGHRGLADIILGSVANQVRHRTHLPVLLLKTAEKPAAGADNASAV